MHYEEMLTWLLFYTSLLDLDKVAGAGRADPGGLVRSQVIEAADGSAAPRAQRLAKPARCRWRTGSVRIAREFGVT